MCLIRSRRFISHVGFNIPQRKFRQADEDDSYFNDDDDAIEGINGATLSVNGGC